MLKYEKQINSLPINSKMYEPQLKELGLTDNEIRIYLLLLQEGTLNPTMVSQKLGLHRGYVYDALERMQEKLVVNSILQNNKKMFQATPPENIVQLLKARLENFQSIVPDLTQIMNLERDDTRVELHKGKKVYRIILRDIMATCKRNETVLVVGVDEQNLLTTVEPIYLRQYFNFIARQGIKEQVIMAKGKSKTSAKNVEYRFLDKKYVGKVEHIIYASKVALFLLGTPRYLIIIDNNEVADTYRKQFELLWGQASSS